MQNPIKGLLCLPALLVTACQSIPNIEDLTRVETTDIIKHILCEAKRALRREQFAYGNANYSLAFTFDFNAKQKNKKSGDVNLTFPVALGNLEIGLSSGSIEDENFSQNKMKISRPFSVYHQLECKLHPSRQLTTEPAEALPIRGAIGIAEVLDQYFSLKDFSAGELADFAEQLEFKVVLDAGTKGSVSLTRANGEKIAANSSATGTRTDFHKVTVTIVKNPKALTAAEAEAKRIKDRTYYVIDATQRPKEIKPPPNAADTKKTKRQQKRSRQKASGSTRSSTTTFAPAPIAPDAGINQLRRIEQNDLLKDLRDEIQELRAE
jgi:hypothetical protein